jgi:HSP20 family protein
VLSAFIQLKATLTVNSLYHQTMSDSSKVVSKKSNSRPRNEWEAFWGPLVHPSFMRWDLANDDGGFNPSIDIHEDDKALTFDVELAGIPKEAINVEVHDGVLTVSGEKKYEKKEEKDGKVHRIERRYGSFKRSISLPETADADNVEANSDNGVLHIRVAKKAPKTPAAKKISVK